MACTIVGTPPSYLLLINAENYTKPLPPPPPLPMPWFNVKSVCGAALLAAQAVVALPFTLIRFGTFYLFAPRTLPYGQEASRNAGWGERAGGIVIAGHEQEICGVLFRGNSLRSLQSVSTRTTAGRSQSKLLLLLLSSSSPLSKWMDKGNRRGGRGVGG